MEEADPFNIKVIKKILKQLLVYTVELSYFELSGENRNTVV